MQADESAHDASIPSHRSHFRKTSMHRYYMTPETRQAVIEESNRLIASRAAVHASRTEPASDSSTDSAFARLVADLQSLSKDSAFADQQG